MCLPGATRERSSNRLAHEKSPYLLQHAHNPVHWYPWCDEAFQKAKAEDKPVFLSIGYSTCHWCHVMAHESFEDEEVARVINRHYIAIKVDREERPDIDKIYMSVCISMTGHGGWPLSIFMTPDSKPFFAGTYFPKASRGGMPGLLDLLAEIAGVWRNDRSRIVESSDEIAQAIERRTGMETGPHAIGVDTLRKAYAQLVAVFDARWGGLGGAPKFPTPHYLGFLLRWHKRSDQQNALEMVERTLEAMRNGGIFDQLGFGFHRYSVDEKWLVPHFEKMLYDQALIAMAYTEAYQATGKASFGKVAREIFTYVLRDMTSAEGGFYSAQDADSEGKEGIFYLWSRGEVTRHLGKDLGDLFCRFYDITESGNFEKGLSIPHVPVSLQQFAESEGLEFQTLELLLQDACSRLFDLRQTRVQPAKDDKVLTSWNGLMIAALAKGYQAFGDRAYAYAAQKAAGFILKHLKASNGRLLRRYRQADAAYPAYLDDYAFLVWGLIELYEATFEVAYLQEAIALNESMIEIFWDVHGGGFYFTGEGNEPLIARSKEIHDGALPSGNSVAASNLMRLGRMTGKADLGKRAEELVQTFSDQVAEHPMGYTQLLVAVDFMVGPCKEIVIVGDLDLELTRDMIRAVQVGFVPNKVLLLLPHGTERKSLLSLSPFLKNMVPPNNVPTAFICEQYACQEPITSLSALEAAL